MTISPASRHRSAGERHAEWRVVEPGRSWALPSIRLMWEYRELMYFLGWRDIKVRYKQSVLGVTWAVLQPALSMVIFWIIFGHFVRLSSDGVPYPLFVLTALLPWTWFSFSIGHAGNSLVSSAPLISKVYFPRLIVPVAACLVGVVDFAIGLVLLLGVMIATGRAPHLAALTLPLFVLLLVVGALSASIWLSALNVKYRDIRSALPFLTQIWFYVTPIVYSSTLIDGKVHYLFALNPLSGVVEGFRWALLGVPYSDSHSLVVSAVMSIVSLIAGLLYFHRVEQQFADVI